GLTWPEKLGEELGRSFRKVWTNNAGMDGHTTFGHRALLDEYIFRLKPKVVIFLVGSNDMGKDAATRMDRLLTENGPDRPLSARLFVAAASRSAVASLARNLYLSFRAREAGLGHRETDFVSLKPVAAPPGLLARVLADHGAHVPAYRARLEALARDAKAAGIEPVFATTPLPCGSGKDPATGADLALMPLPEGSPFVNCGVQWAALELYNDATRKAAASSGSALVDLAVRLPKDTRYFYDFSHFTAEGTAEAARIMYSELCPRLAAEYPDLFTGKCFSTAKNGVAGQARAGRGVGP
ncbi:MAG TPA: SGNH/GDSL hydrolase family protein, partial [Elusimicrobiales bacterium]|nr:SGNH/GDSL hydrolase family protein [Elusimicrobiales bacterium]